MSVTLANRLVILVLVIIIMILFIPGDTIGQTQEPVVWLQASGGPFRTASIDPARASGTITSPVLLWGGGLAAHTGSGWGWNPVHSQPIVGNIDGQNQPEVVICDSAGNLIVLDGLTGEVKAWGWTGCAPHSPPALVDFDRDGILEAIVVLQDDGIIVVDIYETGTWTVNPLQVYRSAIGRAGGILVHDLDNNGVEEIVAQGAGAIVAVDPSSQSIIWKAEHGEWSPGLAPLLAGDIDSDGVNDIVVAGFYGTIKAFSGASGALIWSINLWNDPRLASLFIVAQPLAVDFDGDGVLEIIASIGREIFDWDPGAGNSDRTSTGLIVSKQGSIGYLLIIDSLNGVVELVIPAGPAWAWFAQPSMASYDLDGDSQWEVVFTSVDGYLYLADYNNGVPQVWRLVKLDDWWAWSDWITYVGDPATTGAPPSSAALALADLDSDNIVEAVCVTTSSIDGLPRYAVKLVDPLSNTTEWTFWIDWTMVGVASYSYSYFAWPGLAVADLDADGSLEVLATVYQGVVAVDG